MYVRLFHHHALSLTLLQPDAKELLRQRRLGFSFVRLLPKETGVRPIVNLRRRTTRQGGERSINQILQAAFQILTYEKVSGWEAIFARRVADSAYVSGLAKERERGKRSNWLTCAIESAPGEPRRVGVQQYGGVCEVEGAQGGVAEGRGWEAVRR